MTLFSETYTKKEAEALHIINRALVTAKAANPVVLSSFGKDSLALLSLVRRVIGKYPDTVFWMDGLPVRKYVHAFKTAAEMGLRLFTYPPTGVDYIQREDFFDVIHYFYVTERAFVTLFTGCRQYKRNEKYLCTVNDLLAYPRVDRYEFKWDCIFQGQKATDDVHITGEYSFKSPINEFDDRLMVYPLYNWTDEDVWAYLDRFSVKKYAQRKRYANNPTGRSKSAGNDYENPDVAPACYACLDYRNEDAKIMCPKSKAIIPFAGKGREEARITNELLIQANTHIVVQEAHG